MQTLSIRSRKNTIVSKLARITKIGIFSFQEKEQEISKVEDQVMKEEALFRAKLLGGIAYQLKKEKLPFQDLNLIEYVKRFNIAQSVSEDKRVLQIAQAWVEGWELSMFNAKVSKLVYWNENELPLEKNIEAFNAWNQIKLDYAIDIKAILQD